MSIDYQRMSFDYRRCAEQEGSAVPLHPVIVVGAGPVGLAAAIDVAQRGVPVVLVDDDRTLSTGSRAICFSKRSLDIFDRLGCGERMVDKGVRWSVGKVFVQDEHLYTFDLLPEGGQRRPAFINLQQYYVEGFLVERAQELANLEIRWNSKVTGIRHNRECSGHGIAFVTLTVETPDGPYELRGRYVVAADGAKSPLRTLLGLNSQGRTFKDRFLIADVKMKAPFPSERWFWFDPPFHPHQSVLLHRQPDNVWRIDFQLGWDADPVIEKTPERIIPRVRALLGPEVEFEMEWASVYTFSCVRMAHFRHGNVLFAGDCAHSVSPFGARGANSGIQDAENLAWKLELVLAGRAPDSLLDSYASEREYAADENIRNSSRSTDFITPKTPVSRVFRDAVLTLARCHPFARQLVNTGRLSVPAVLRESPLNTPDRDRFEGQMAPGAVCVDAPVRCGGQDGWLLSHLGGQFTAMVFCGAQGADAANLGALAVLRDMTLPVRRIALGARDIDAYGQADAAAQDGVTWLDDCDGTAAQRYDASPGTVYLIRPDQHVCARWRHASAADLEAAFKRALGVRGTA